MRIRNFAKYKGPPRDLLFTGDLLFMKPFTFDFGTCSYSENIASKPFQRINRPEQPQNLCPYPIPSLDEIIKDIDNESRNVDKSKFVSDLFECGALAIANTVDLIQKDKREERYKQVMSAYQIGRAHV